MLAAPTARTFEVRKLSRFLAGEASSDSPGTMKRRERVSKGSLWNEERSESSLEPVQISPVQIDPVGDNRDSGVEGGNGRHSGREEGALVKAIGLIGEGGQGSLT